MSDRELALIRWLQDELNRQIASVIADIQKETAENRLFYADDVVHAVEPDHTLCGDERWINGVFDKGAFGALNGAKRQELIHPNQAGYAAEAAALLRWSRGETEAVPGPVRDDRPWLIRGTGNVIDGVYRGVDATVRGAQDLWHGIQEIDLEAPSVMPVVPGIQYRVNTGGFEPGGTVVLQAASQPQALASVVADDDGTISAVVRLPADLPPGDHTLFASGFTEDGDMQMVARPMHVFRPSLAGPLTVGLGAALLVVAGLLLLRVARRRHGRELVAG
jgi:hypothetical protein